MLDIWLCTNRTCLANVFGDACHDNTVACLLFKGLCKKCQSPSGGEGGGGREGRRILEIIDIIARKHNWVGKEHNIVMSKPWRSQDCKEERTSDK